MTTISATALQQWAQASLNLLRAREWNQDLEVKRHAQIEAEVDTEAHPKRGSKLTAITSLRTKAGKGNPHSTMEENDILY